MRLISEGRLKAFNKATASSGKINEEFSNGHLSKLRLCSLLYEKLKVVLYGFYSQFQINRQYREQMTAGRWVWCPTSLAATKHFLCPNILHPLLQPGCERDVACLISACGIGLGTEVDLIPSQLQVSFGRKKKKKKTDPRLSAQFAAAVRLKSRSGF